MATLILSIVLFIAGIVLLIKGADWLVNNASKLARHLGVSPLLVGLTIVAFGTSLPEFTVSLLAVLKGTADISIGNIVGSNIANIGLVLGIGAILTPLVINLSTLIHEMPYLMVSAILMIILSLNRFILGQGTFGLEWFDGVIMLIIFGLFTYYVAKTALRQNKQKRATDKIAQKEFSKEYRKEKINVWATIGKIAISLVIVVVGGRLTVNGGVDIATIAGISEKFIGLTVIALGTSLPELITAIVAIVKKEGDIAVGTIVGSNIFNSLLVLGTVSIIKPIVVNPSILFVDMIVMLAFSLLLLLFITTGRKLDRWEGIVLFTGYVGYIVYLTIGL